MDSIPEWSYSDSVPSKAELLDAIDDVGCVLVRNVPTETNAALCSLASRVGHAIRPEGPSTTGRVENDIVYRVEPGGCGAAAHSHTRSAFECHTDGFRCERVPDVVLLLTVRAADSGGETILIDADSLVQTLDPSVIADLLVPRYRFGSVTRAILPRTIGRAQIAFNAFDTAGVPVRSRSTISDLELRAMLRRDTSAFALREAIRTFDTPFVSKLERGDCLVLNNRRVLHGRKAFEGSRLVRRVWVLRNDSDRQGLS